MMKRKGVSMEAQLNKFLEMIEISQKIVFFEGAGVSTASGIPDFRSADGIFMQATGTQFQPEQIISHSFFERYPDIYFDFHFDKLVYPQAQPNIGHFFPVYLQELGKDVHIVTQNIDGLDILAGANHVYELHGNVRENYCLDCGRTYGLEELVKDEQGIPRCPKDQGIIRPNIVMYEESLNQATIQSGVEAIASADMLIVMGTSLMVYPAASFIQYFTGDHFVVINQSPIQVHRSNALVFQDTIANVLNPLQMLMNKQSD